MDPSSKQMFKDLLKVYKDEWALCDEKIKSCVEIMVIDNVNLKDKLHLFLYAKGIWANRTSAERKALFNEILDPTIVSSQRALERLKAIVQTGESPTKLFLETNEHKKSFFDKFVEDHPEWKGKDVFVVPRDHPNLTGKPHALVERHQKSGLCHMHAPIVLQHYLVAMNNNEAIPMLDMVKYLREKMDAAGLYEHIWENRGGESLLFLEKILQKNTLEIKSTGRRKQGKIIKNLHEFGPALLSRFNATESFTDTNQWQHLGSFKENERILGRHAMVLIGYRHVGKDIRFLLQNWWSGKPYIEVDTDYLCAADGRICFVKEKQFAMGNFTCNYEPFVECQDVEESFYLENISY